MARGTGATNGCAASPRTLAQAADRTEIVPTGTTGWAYRVTVSRELGQLSEGFAALYPAIAHALPAYDPATASCGRRNDKRLYLQKAGTDELAWEHERGSRWLLSVEHRCLIHERKIKGTHSCRFFWLDGGQEFEQDGQQVATREPNGPCLTANGPRPYPAGDELGFALPD
jgi:hypothetical protein